MAAITLVSTLLMGLILLVIVAAVAGSRNWRREAPETPGERGASFAARAARDPDTWGLVFVVIVLAITAGAIVFVGGFSIPGADQQTVGLLLGAVFGTLLAVLLLGGIYTTARARGAGRSLAVAVGAGLLGLLFVAAIAAQLLLG